MSDTIDPKILALALRVSTAMMMTPPDANELTSVAASLTGVDNELASAVKKFLQNPDDENARLTLGNLVGERLLKKAIQGDYNLDIRQGGSVVSTTSSPSSSIISDQTFTRTWDPLKIPGATIFGTPGNAQIILGLPQIPQTIKDFIRDPNVPVEQVALVTGTTFPVAMYPDKLDMIANNILPALRQAAAVANRLNAEQASLNSAASKSATNLSYCGPGRLCTEAELAALGKTASPAQVAALAAAKLRPAPAQSELAAAESTAASNTTKAVATGGGAVVGFYVGGPIGALVGGLLGLLASGGLSVSASGETKI